MEKINSKTIKIISGSYGSGKSTFAESYFLKRLKISQFINTDKIASGLSPIDTDKAAFQANRIVLAVVKKAIENGENFSFETTLSEVTWSSILKNALEHGYKIILYFIYLDNAQKNIQRIKNRVTDGRCFVPSEIVREQYQKSFLTFWKIYRPLCEDWFILDNSKSKPKLIHSKITFSALSFDQKNSFKIKFLKEGVRRQLRMGGPRKNSLKLLEEALDDFPRIVAEKKRREKKRKKFVEKTFGNLTRKVEKMMTENKS